jgi:hypothetical protein
MAKTRSEKLLETNETGGEIVHPGASGFLEKVTPKKLNDKLHFFKCTNCGNAHFRHAGYMESMVPLMRQGGEKTVIVDSYQVKLCVKCKRSYIWVNEQMYDITEHIDLSAWEKTEQNAYKATGPGGQC